MRSLLLAFVVSLGFLADSAHGSAPEGGRQCGTPQPSAEWNEWFNEKVNNRPFFQVSRATQANIPVIVHVIHNGESVGMGSNLSKAQIDSQISVLNADFAGTGYYSDFPLTALPTPFAAIKADSKIKFYAAKKDPAGNILAEPGIHRVYRSTLGLAAPGAGYSVNTVNSTIKPNTIWDPARYLNVWVVSLGDNLLGYATFPAGSLLAGIDSFLGTSTTDGVVILNSAFGDISLSSPAYPYNLGRTATHEIGHWLGLRHIWGDATCGNDYVDDTPVAEVANYGCYGTFPYSNNSNPGTCAAANPSLGEMYQNFMDYGTDGCLSLFTIGQSVRFDTALANGTFRVGLHASAAIVAAICGDGQLDPGEGCDDGNQNSSDGCSYNACQIEPGYTCPTVGQLCTQIPTCSFGQYFNGISCVLLTDCTAGQYQSTAPTPISDRVCTACSAGNYSTTINASSCTAWSTCSAGTQVNFAGSSTQDRTCTTCSLGFFTSAPNQTSCAAWSTCSAGTQVNFAGSSTQDRTCTTCLSGFFTSAPNQTSCAAWASCSAGTEVSFAGSSTQDRSCSACVGSYSTTVNASSCAAWATCSAGQFESTAPTATSNRVCAPCSAGSYSATINAGSCTVWSTCTGSQYQSVAPTATNDRVCTALTDCSAGQYQSTAPTPISDRACSPCVGSYSTTTNAGSCITWSTCTANQYQTAAPTATSNRVCAALTNCSPGQYVSSLPTSIANRVCSSCAAGTYSTLNNQTACTACPAGTTSGVGATACQSIPPVSPVCGDGIRASGEACDDGNDSEGDGCSTACAVESGYDCTTTSCHTVCGDGLLVGAESCDDGNDSEGDGCSTACALEPGLEYSKFDSDGDTLSDELEGRNPVAPLSSVIKAFSTLGVDHDDDGIPDFLDTDSDNDGTSDKEEVVCTATNELSLCIATADADGDGAPDYADLAPNTPSVGGGGSGASDASAVSAGSGGSSGCSVTGSDPQNMPLAEILFLGLVGLMLMFARPKVKARV